MQNCSQQSRITLQKSLIISVPHPALALGIFGVVFFAVSISSVTLAASPEVLELEAKSGDSTTATGMSGDGSVIVGITKSKRSLFNPAGAIFVWRRSGVEKPLGSLRNSVANAWAVSSDGTVIVGDYFTQGWRSHAFRWSESGGIDVIGSQDWINTSARGVSANGLVVVGTFLDSSKARHVFRWTPETAADDLGTFGASGAQASGVSADGATIVGNRFDLQGNPRAIKWNATEGVTELGAFGDASDASGISSDGSIIVGQYFTAKHDGKSTGSQFDQHNFVWTKGGKVRAFDSWDGRKVTVHSVSADGLKIVGSIEGADGLDRPFVAPLSAISLSTIDSPSTSNAPPSPNN
jgi:probable HAF family extracellular repeat protein